MVRAVTLYASSSIHSKCAHRSSCVPSLYSTLMCSALEAVLPTYLPVLHSIPVCQQAEAEPGLKRHCIVGVISSGASAGSKAWHTAPVAAAGSQSRPPEVPCLTPEDDDDDDGIVVSEDDTNSSSNDDDSSVDDNNSSSIDEDKDDNDSSFDEEEDEDDTSSSNDDDEDDDEDSANSSSDDDSDDDEDHGSHANPLQQVMAIPARNASSPRQGSSR